MRARPAGPTASWSTSAPAPRAATASRSVRRAATVRLAATWPRAALCLPEPTMHRSRVSLSLTVTGIALLVTAGCSTPQDGASSAPPPASAAVAAQPAPPPAAPAPPPPLAPAPFPETIARAGERLLQDALTAVGPGPRELVIDPLIDAST